MQQTTWLEQNLSLLINHFVELVDSSCTATSHNDAVHCRKCVTLIFRTVLVSHRDEQAQLRVAKELLAILTRYATSSSMNSNSNSMIQSYEPSIAIHSDSLQIESNQHVLIYILQELCFLIENLGISTRLLLHDHSTYLFDMFFTLLVHSSYAVRLTMAWCFRSITTVLPSLITPLMDRCLETMKAHIDSSTMHEADVLSGTALALQALVGTVYRCPSGKLYWHI
jgi:HEAT repeat-containing protein 5